MKNADPEHVESSDDSSGSESSYTPRKRWKTTYHGLEYVRLLKIRIIILPS